MIELVDFKRWLEQLIRGEERAEAGDDIDNQLLNNEEEEPNKQAVKEKVSIGEEIDQGSWTRDKS